MVEPVNEFDYSD